MRRIQIPQKGVMRQNSSCCHSYSYPFLFLDLLWFCVNTWKIFRIIEKVISQLYVFIKDWQKLLSGNEQQIQNRYIFLAVYKNVQFCKSAAISVQNAKLSSWSSQFYKFRHFWNLCYKHQTFQPPSRSKIQNQNVSETYTETCCR